MRALMLTAILVSTVTLCLAQEPDTWSWNVQAAWMNPIGSSDFSSINGIPTPGGLLYEPKGSPSNTQFAVGIDGSTHSQLRVGGRLRYASMELRYRANERIVIANPDGPGIYQATIAHDLETHTAAIDAVPYVRYEPLPWLALEIATPIVIPLSSRYRQRMCFADPVDLPFLDGSIERITGQGSIPSLSVASVAVQGRMEGIIPITSSGVLALTPFVALQQSITSPASNGSLRSRAVTAGLGLRSTFNAGTEVAMVPIVPQRVERVLRDTTVELSRLVKQPQTILMSRTSDSSVADGVVSVTIREAYTTFYPKPPAILRVSMKLAFVHDDGSVSDDASVSAQRVRTTHVVQLLPVIVFDNDESVIPQRYVRLSPSEIQTWKTSSLLQDAPTHWQYSIHNIVGSRMRATRAACSLVVYHDGTDRRKAIAEQRVQILRRYMRETFGIDERRLPVRYAVASGILGQSIVFDGSTTILAPLTSTQMLNDTELPTVRVIPDVASEAGVDRWAVTVQTNGRTVRVISDSGGVPSFVPWNMNADLESEARQQDVDIHLEVVDKDSTWARSEPATIRLRSQSTTDRTMIPVERIDYVDVATTIDGLVLSPLDRRDAVRLSAREGVTQWYMRGLVEPERSIYQAATAWRKQERRP
jgi:hypothetical protein